ncbi:MAG: hypothetical protein JEZ07_01010 [Phycisphaerae bacterium]|nr:hypothetical protein [Phycisphaerae bacterium]
MTINARAARDAKGLAITFAFCLFKKIQLIQLILSKKILEIAHRPAMPVLQKTNSKELVADSDSEDEFLTLKSLETQRVLLLLLPYA